MTQTSARIRKDSSTGARSGPPGGARIGEVARRAGLSARAVRHYEALGLIEPEGRSGGGFRLYGEGSLRRLILIVRLKEIGFSLGEIAEILPAGGRGAGDRMMVRRLRDAYADKVARIESQIASLQRARRDLSEVAGMLECCMRCENPRLLDEALCSGCGGLSGRGGLGEVFRGLMRGPALRTKKSGPR
jgi:MerR family copper efflux transcriptional regulator